MMSAGKGHQVLKNKKLLNTIFGVMGLVILLGAAHAAVEIWRHAYIERGLVNVAKSVWRLRLIVYVMRGLFTGLTLAAFFGIAKKITKDESKRLRAYLLMPVFFALICLCAVFAAAWMVRAPLGDQAASELAAWLILTRVLVPTLTDPLTLPRAFIALVALILLLISFFAAMLTSRILFRNRPPGAPRKEVRGLIGYAGLGIVFAAVFSFAFARPLVTDEAAPDIILISIDTLRADHLSCYGYPRPTTPNIDRLAQEGILVEQHISHAPWTLPAHVSMFTGLYPYEHGVVTLDRALGPHTPVLAEGLRERGYHTGAFVSNYLLSPTFGYSSGFDAYTLRSDFSAEDMIKYSEDWLKRNPKPAFLFLHLFDAHYPYAPRKSVRGRFGEKEDGLDEVFKKPFYDFASAAEGYDEKKIRNVLDRYDEEILDADAQIGKLFDFLRKDNRYDGSWIIVTSDHGEEFRDHGLWGHSVTLYEEVLHVPLIVKAPGKACAGTRVTEKYFPQKSIFNLVLNVARQIGSQEIDCAGGRVPKIIEDLMTDGVASETEVFAPHRFAFRKSGKKIIEPYRFVMGSFTVDRKMELFDLIRDAGEKNNLYAPEVAPDLEEALEKLDEAHRAAYGVVTGTSELSPEARERLKSLGYLH